MLTKNAFITLALMLAASLLATHANAERYYLKLVSSGTYAQTNPINDRVSMSADSTKKAQAFEKIPTDKGFVLKAVGGMHDGKYMVEPPSGSRLELFSKKLSDAGVYVDTVCEGGGIFVTSIATQKNVKMESDGSLGDKSHGDCGSANNKFEWVSVSSSENGIAAK